MLIDMDSADRRAANSPFIAMPVCTPFLDRRAPESVDADDELRIPAHVGHPLNEPATAGVQPDRVVGLRAR